MGEEMRLLASLLPSRLMSSTDLHHISSHARFCSAGFASQHHNVLLPRFDGAELRKRRRAPAATAAAGRFAVDNVRFRSRFDSRIIGRRGVRGGGAGVSGAAAGDKRFFGSVGDREYQTRRGGDELNNLGGGRSKLAWLQGKRRVESDSSEYVMASEMCSNSASGDQEHQETEIGGYVGRQVGDEGRGEDAGLISNALRNRRYGNFVGSQQRGGAEKRWTGEEHAPQRWRSNNRWDQGNGASHGGGGRWRGRFLNPARGEGRGWVRKSRVYGEAPSENGEYRREGRVSRSWPGFEEYRYWCNAEKELTTAHEKFVLVSYNILAEKNASQHMNELYHVPWELLRWDRRKSNIVAELGVWSPDIMCLQEVDMFEDLQQEFEGRGYHGIYAGRTGGACDGCAIFWRTSRFRLLEEESIQFKEFGLRDNVAQLCVFQSLSSDAGEETSTGAQSPNSGSSIPPVNLIIVGNIHVLFNPKRGDIKLGQVRVLLKSAHELSQKWGGIPVTIAGDFNSTPQSDLYRFLATSELDISGLNRTTISGQLFAGEGAQPRTFNERMQEVAGMYPPGTERFAQEPNEGNPSKEFVKRCSWTREELRAATGATNCLALRHDLNLRSAYSQIKGEAGCRDARGEPLVTTFHRKFMGTVDYIWHTKDFETVKVLDTLPLNILYRTAGLPSEKWGSDHLALACEFALVRSIKPKES